MCLVLCAFAACGSDNDEPKNEDNKEHIIPEGLVSEVEFHRIVDGKVWIFDGKESVWVKANGEEYPELDYPTSGTCVIGFSFKDGKKAPLVWPCYEKTTYSEYRYEETTGGIYSEFNPEKPGYIVELVTEDKMVLRYRFDMAPVGIGKDPTTWDVDDGKPEKGSYMRTALRVANAEETASYLEHYVEE